MELRLLFPIFFLSWPVLSQNETTAHTPDLWNESFHTNLFANNTEMKSILNSDFNHTGFRVFPASFPLIPWNKPRNLTGLFKTLPFFNLKREPTISGRKGEVSIHLIVNQSITHTTQDYLSSQWLTKFVPSVYTLVVAVALPLNIMAILVCVFKIKIRTPALVYMVNLASSDVLFVSVLPFNIVYRFSENNWHIGDGMCRFVTAAFYCNMYCSVLLMTAISVDRFLAVVYTMKALSWRTKKRAWLVCFFIWIISIASTLPLLISQQTMYIDTLKITTCHDVLDVDDLQNFYMYYFTTFSLLFFFLPLIITTICYISIIKKLSTKDIENSCKKKRAVILSIIVFFAFVICFGPTNIVFLIHYLHFHNNIDETMYFTYILCTCISSISTCLDPLIYYYASSKYREHAYSLLSCKKSNEELSAKQNLTGLSTENTSTV